MTDAETNSTLELLRQLESGDPPKVVAAARELAARQELSAATPLLELLRTTNDVTARNAAALALGDLKHPPAFDVLVDLLKDERTRGSRGTLLYAIGAFECSSILPTLVDFVIDGNFEVSRQAFSLIGGIETEVDERTWDACTSRLRNALVVAPDERRPLLRELLELFEQEDE
jgi:HEAT repeat protein